MNGNDVEWDSKGMPLGDDPAAVLGLPEGLLALEGLPLMFQGAVGYPVERSRVLAAAQHILEHRSPGQKEQVFHNQAEVMAFASRQFGWHTGHEMGFAAVPNLMHLPRQEPAAKEARADELDMMIEVMKSGLLTTREGTRKLMPEMPEEAFEQMWAKHDARRTEAHGTQARQMESILEKIKAERQARGEAPDAPSANGGKSLAEKVKASRANPCLGI